MKREDLFLAIGEVESSRLLRSELTVQSPSVTDMEDANMKKKSVGVGRVIRSLLIAAVLVSMLAVTAYAVGGYLIFDSPEEMLTAIFGDKTGYDHSDGVPQYNENGELALVTPTFDRVAADETVIAENVAPHISPVGRTISQGDYTLTVDAYMYDSVTKCGLLTYTLENSNGLPEYKLQPNGEIWFPGGELVNMNNYGRCYIIQEKTTGTKLAATLYFQYNSRSGDAMEISFTQWAWGLRDKMAQLREEICATVSEEEAITHLKEKAGEEVFAQVYAEYSAEELAEAAYTLLVDEKLVEWENAMEPETISIACDTQSTLEHVTLGSGSVVITPICFQIDVTDLEFLHEDRIHADNVDTVSIRFTDGGEYVVDDAGVKNYLFAHNTESPKVVGENYNMLTYMFNRVIDIDDVASVIINGTELPVD